MIKKRDIFENKDIEEMITWKSVHLLKRYMTRFGDIKGRKYTGNSVKHQKAVRIALIRARELGLVPYIR